MIKTLSPYYITIPLVSPSNGLLCNSYKLQLFVWNGSKTAVPASPSYEKTIFNAAASTGSQKINIARLVNDFIDFQINPIFETGLQAADNQAWVKWQVVYDVDSENPQLVGLDLAVKGKAYFTDGENTSTPANRILLTGDEFKVSRQGLFVLPIKILE
jgi:hypothetical protein